MQSGAGRVAQRHFGQKPHGQRFVRQQFNQLRNRQASISSTCGFEFFRRHLAKQRRTFAAQHTQIGVKLTAMMDFVFEHYLHQE